MTAEPAPIPPLTSDDAPKRAVIYCRISFDRTKEGKGVDRQEDACRALARSRGWQVVDVVVENDTSATKGKRPLYSRMIADAKAGHYDVILGWAVDRLTRSPREVEDLIALSESTGVLVATVSGDLDLTTDQGRLVGRILGSVARGETERKTVRMKAAYRQSAEAGEQPRMRAFGYRPDGTIDPVEGPVVKELFARYVAGQGALGLAKWLNEAGHRNTKGQPFTHYGLTWMLQNPRYIAERWRVTDKNLPGTQQREYVGPGNWEPIIDEATFKAAQARFADNLVGHPRNGPNKKHLGAGLLICGVDGCGRTLRSYWQQRKLASGKITKNLRYACYPVRHLIRDAPKIDELVIAKVTAYLRDNDLAELMRDDKDAALTRSLREEAVGLHGTLAELATAIMERRMSPALAGAAESKINARLAMIDDRLAKAGQRSALALVAGAADPGAAWQELAKRDLRAAQEVARAAVTITVMPGKPGRAPFDPTTIQFEWTATANG